jgi:hypothetical protein
MYEFEVYYDQEEGEILNNYIFNLYNIQGSLISTSGNLYNTSASSPIIVSYSFSGLGDNTSYYIQVTGVTSQGTQISTSMELFYVQYTQPSVYSVIELNNNCDGGYITIKSNLTAIEGESNPSPPTYIDDNTAVDVTGVGDYILWDNGYAINKDFTASLWGHNFNENETIITMTDGNTILTVNYRKYNDYLYFVELLVKNINVSYYIYSNPLYILPNDNLQIWIRRVNNLYEISLYDLVERFPLILDSSSQGLLDVNILN